MTAEHGYVPWRHRVEFKEVLDFLSVVDRRRGPELEPLRHLARQIGQCFGQMADGLDLLCAQTCPGCTDNCCQRAVIWYDFKDLLYLYFSLDSGQARMPDRQIVKSKNQCPNLGTEGCRLPRDRRPFVCTWYFCPAQKLSPDAASLNHTVLEIKAMRIEMENEFCQITGGRLVPGRL